MIARQSSPELACTPEGDFEALQCREEAGVTTCQCVLPEDGAPLPGTQVIITDLDYIPDCNLKGLEAYLLYHMKYCCCIVNSIFGLCCQPWWSSVWCS